MRDFFLPREELLAHTLRREHGSRAHQALPVALRELLDVVLLHGTRAGDLEEIARDANPVDVARDEPPTVRPPLKCVAPIRYVHSIRGARPSAGRPLAPGR